MDEAGLTPSTSASLGGPGPRGYRVESVLIFCLGLLAFLIAPVSEFIGLEARFALFAQTMLREGPSLFPKTYVGAYPDYPVTPTFLIYLFARLWGRLTPLCAFLPTAIASSLTLVVIFRIAVIHSRLWGWYALLLAILTQQFLAASRSISPDQYTSLVTSLCFYWAYRGLILGGRSPTWLVAFALAVGFACRGPIGLIVPAGVMCGVYAAGKDYRGLLRVGVSALVVLAVCCGLLLAAAYNEGGTPFVQEVVKMQALGRLVGKAHGPTFYWLDSFATYAIAYPLAVLVMALCVPPSWVRTPDGSERRLLKHLVVWAFVVLVGLSIPSEKKTRYILPAVPAFALLAAYIFVEPSPSRILSRIRAALLTLCDWLPVASLLGAVAAFALRSRFTPPLDAHRLVMAMAVLGLATIAWAVLRTTGRVRAAVLRVGVAAASFVVVHLGVVETVMLDLEGSAPFVREVAAKRAEAPGPIVFWRIGPDQADVRFMVNEDSAAVPGFVSALDDLLSCDARAWVIATVEDFADLPPDAASRFAVEVHGRIGHEECVAFRALEPDRLRRGPPIGKGPSWNPSPRGDEARSSPR
jgi:4-amino-4-deoxy-L-arabinose transferase-like glycosyltransferase